MMPDPRPAAPLLLLAPAAGRLGTATCREQHMGSVRRQQARTYGHQSFMNPVHAGKHCRVGISLQNGLCTYNQTPRTRKQAFSSYQKVAEYVHSEQKLTSSSSCNSNASRSGKSSSVALQPPPPVALVLAPAAPAPGPVSSSMLGMSGTAWLLGCVGS